MTDDIRSRLKELTASNKYVLEKTFAKQIYFFNMKFNYDNMPTDFRYAYPIIYLLKSTR